MVLASFFCLPSVGRCRGIDGYAWHIYETQSYLIVITETWTQGDLECDATYTGTNKKSGSSISLKGKCDLRMCANDPSTPCGVDGWHFSNGSTDYLFITNGQLSLTVSDKRKPVLGEEAKLVAEGDGLGVSYAAACIAISRNGCLSYVEAEFFGGSGTQGSAVFRNGKKAGSIIVDEHAINDALVEIGVQRLNHQDEFDALGLGKYRNTEDWLLV